MWWCINFVDFTVWIWIFIWDNLTIESHSRIHATCDPFWSWNQRSVFRENNQERENNILFVKMFALSVRPYCHLPPVKNVPYLFLSITVDRVRLDRSKIVWKNLCRLLFLIIYFIFFNIENIILILSRYLFGKKQPQSHNLQRVLMFPLSEILCCGLCQKYCLFLNIPLTMFTWNFQKRINYSENILFEDKQSLWYIKPFK